jgi:hypothetical protein
VGRSTGPLSNAAGEQRENHDAEQQGDPFH